MQRQRLIVFRYLALGNIYEGWRKHKGLAYVLKRSVTMSAEEDLHRSRSIWHALSLQSAARTCAVT